MKRRHKRLPLTPSRMNLNMDSYDTSSLADGDDLGSVDGEAGGQGANLYTKLRYLKQVQQELERDIDALETTIGIMGS